MAASETKKPGLKPGFDLSRKTYLCGAVAPPGISFSMPSSCGVLMAALSGFNKPSWLGPRPSLISARESGRTLVCQWLSAWNLVRAALVDESKEPDGSPWR